MQQPVGASTSVSGNAELYFKGDLSLYRDPNVSDRINLIQQGDPMTLRRIITSIKFVDSDGRRLHHPHFVFDDTVNLEVTKGMELSPWYYNQKGVVYALPLLEYHHSLLYFRNCTED